MSKFFQPSLSSDPSTERKFGGYVSRLKELPLPCARFEGAVVFCAEDKYFYECQHVFTTKEDYFKWTAVTTGGRRVMFVPVEALTQSELPNEAIMAATIRTSCFDAIASAIDEIVIGMVRYGYNIDPLCYKRSYDQTYVEGRKYYVFNNRYDRAEYVPTVDPSPVEDKPYYLPDVNLHYATVFPASFEPGVVYYESKRPQFIRDPDYVAGNPIEKTVFISNGIEFNEATKRQLVVMVNKINLIIEAINQSGAHLKKAEDDGTLFDLCESLNAVIVELNPFAYPWNSLLNRVNMIERTLEAAELGIAKTFNLPITVSKGGVKYILDIRDGDGTREVVCDLAPED